MSADDIALAHGRLIDEYLATKAKLTDLANQANRVGSILSSSGSHFQNFSQTFLQEGTGTLGSEGQLIQLISNPSSIAILIKDIGETAQKFSNLQNRLRALGLNA